jgi:hypothetical protein
LTVGAWTDGVMDELDKSGDASISFDELATVLASPTPEPMPVRPRPTPVRPPNPATNPPVEAPPRSGVWVLFLAVLVTAYVVRSS